MIRGKHQKQSVLLLYSNVNPHFADTCWDIGHVSSEILEQASYSLDFAFLDFHLYGPLIDALLDSFCQQP
jgi:hypothetical protein